MYADRSRDAACQNDNSDWRWSGSSEAYVPFLWAVKSLVEERSADFVTVVKAFEADMRVYQTITSTEVTLLARFKTVSFDFVFDFTIG